MNSVFLLVLSVVIVGCDNDGLNITWMKLTAGIPILADFQVTGGLPILMTVDISAH